MAKHSVRNFSSATNAFAAAADVILEDEAIKELDVKHGLESETPNQMAVHYSAGLAAATQGDLDGAQRHLSWVVKVYENEGGGFTIQLVVADTTLANAILDAVSLAKVSSSHNALNIEVLSRLVKLLTESSKKEVTKVGRNKDGGLIVELADTDQQEDTATEIIGKLGYPQENQDRLRCFSDHDFSSLLLDEY